MSTILFDQQPETAAPPKVLNKRLIGWSILGLLLAGLISIIAWRIAHALTARPNAVPSAIPTVSVTEVGISAVPTTVSIIGTIAARYDMPIGVEGDGGRVTAVYVEAGDHVKRSQVLAHLDNSVLEPQVTNLAAALDQARAEAALAEAEYQRARAVGSLGALSAEETQRRKSSAVTAATHVKVAEAQLDEAKARLARADVRAPADGIILTRNVEVGQTAMPGGEALFRLSKDGETELRGQVAEQDLPSLKVGQGVQVRLTGNSKVYPGRIRLIGAIIDPATRLGTAKIALSPDPNLRPGAFARAEVTVSNARRAVLPQTAVLNDDKGSYVLIVNAQGKVERRAVHVSGMVPSGVTIADGLDPKDQIVTAAGAFLQEGETVKPVVVTAAAKS
ncbi:MAG TPA: efflux RND transporter periplasmic adaptor subunit [Steroidobacteraceae bacterium]|jgi:RND family efflux transporter MFP subunit|nr:efflux RND transporter periplasmic adaptor subunit [Steroidobacteraceae bacterium]